MSTAICNATNSEPNVEDSNFFCALEYHMTRALQIDQDACLGLTCDSTTSMVSVYKMLICTGFPFGSGALECTASIVPL